MSSVRNDIPALTSIRGVAAICVVFFHIYQTYRGDFIFFQWFKNGDLGVDLFFVLSGFILAYVYDRKLDDPSLSFFDFYKVFILTRIVRIYPLHIFTLLFVLVLVLFLPGFYDRQSKYFTELSFLANILLIQNWGFINISWNTVSWSISAEFFMYLIFPVFLYFKGFIKNQWAIAILALLTLIVHHLIILKFNLSGYGGMSLGGMIRVFFEFSLGFLGFYSRGLLKSLFNNNRDFFGFLLVGGLLVSLYSSYFWFVFLPSSTLLIVYLCIVESRISKALSNQFFVHLGDISFSVYMWHWIIIQIHNWAAENDIISVNDTLSIYIACVSLAILSIVIGHYSYVYIECPTRKYGRKYINKQRNNYRQ